MKVVITKVMLTKYKEPESPCSDVGLVQTQNFTQETSIREDLWVYYMV